MHFGYFDDDQREFIVTRPDTPLPWINYLGNQRYFALISNTAGGYSFYQDARLRRITRFRYNNVPTDYGGRYLYLRDADSGLSWSPTWQPMPDRELHDYRCHHGLGYTRISSRYQDIQARIRYFVPLDQDLEIWDLALHNQRPSPAQLSLFSLVEFALWDAWDDQSNYQRNLNTGEVEIDSGVIYHRTEYRERRNHYAYFACSAPAAGFDTQREAFLGPYRGWHNPLVVERGAANNSVAHGWSPIGSHQVDLVLEPGASTRIIFVLGYQENQPSQKFDPTENGRINKRPAQATLQRFLDPEQVDLAFAQLEEYWDRVLSVYQVKTPDEHTNRMLNIWNAYQCMVTFNLSRSASYFESGVGRGMGFRDSNQDILGFVHMIPERARQRLLDLAATQLESGGAYHQYQPLTKRGNDAVGGNFNDDPLWLVLATAAYLKESGDYQILQEPVPYENRPGTETPLAEHLERCIQYTLERLGPHRLPLIGRADWNDCLNLNTFSDEPGESFQTTTNRDGKTAESVFIAGLFTLAAREMAELVSAAGAAHEQPKWDAGAYRQLADEMAATTLAQGWDGAWFLRAYDNFGDKVGSHTCQEGQIFIEPQGLCVMAGIGHDDGRAQQALESVAQRLATGHGILLHQPAYTQYHLHLGEISSYPPGYKENGSIFCHTNPWIMIAETMLGNGDRAHDYYLRINPSARAAISEVHRSEPYVYAQTIAGRDAASFGEAKNSWLTGTAAWNYVAISQWILGIRPEHHGLRIHPVLPQSWQGFQARRFFRGVEYQIEAHRQGSGNRVQLVVDGQAIAGQVVPPPGPDVQTIQIQVIIGE